MRPIAVLGAPSNLGLKPYSGGRPRGVDRAPRVYRELGLVGRLGARDLGDIQAPPYADFERPPGGTRNESAIAAYSRSLADAVSGVEGFLLVLGGDCSILLGILLWTSPRKPWTPRSSGSPARTSTASGSIWTWTCSIPR